MLKVRIIPTLLYQGANIVKSIRFQDHRRVGTPLQAISVYNMRDVDELLFLDIGASAGQSSPDFQLIDEIADESFMPLAVGGGIRSVEDVRSLLAVGADKVVVNTIAAWQPTIIKEIAAQFGRQCIVAAIDVQIVNGRRTCFCCNGREALSVSPTDLAHCLEKFGAGEILLTSIDRDGTMSGFDVDLIRDVSSRVDIPVIASGGAGNPDHFVDALRAGASAVAAGSIFLYTEITPDAVKRHLSKYGFPVRM